MFSANEITSSFPYKRIFKNLFISRKIHARKAGRPRPLCGGFRIGEWKQFVLPSQWNERKQHTKKRHMLPFTCPSITPSSAGSIHCTGSVKYEVHFSRPSPQSWAESVILLWAKAAGPLPSTWDKMLELRNRARLPATTEGKKRSKTSNFTLSNP